MVPFRTDTTDLSHDNLLTIFRYAIAIRFIISLILWFLLPSQENDQNLGRILTIVDPLLLTIYLFATPLHTLLKDRYFPIALVWATVVPILTSTLTMYLFFTTPTSGLVQSQIGVVENFVIFYNVGLSVTVLLIPLLIVSWLYSRRIVVFYLLGITLFEALLVILFVPLGGRLSIVIALIVFRLLVLGFVGLIVNHLVEIQRTQAQALRDYATTREHLIASRERNRIAREMHDTLAHTLAATSVQLEAVQVIWDAQPDRAKQLVQDSANTVRSGLEDTRRALQALRVETLESVGFVQSIHNLVDSINKRYELTATMEDHGDVLWLTNEQEHILYRITQEALFNSAEHAQAKNIRVRLKENDQNLTLSVVDDGIGFEQQTVDIQSHFGVQGMRERADMIGAQLIINSTIGIGTTIKLIIQRETSGHSHLR